MPSSTDLSWPSRQVKAGARAVGQRGIEKNSPAGALGDHTVPHLGTTCFVGGGENCAGLEPVWRGCLASPDVSLDLVGSVSGESWSPYLGLSLLTRKDLVSLCADSCLRAPTLWPQGRERLPQVVHSLSSDCSKGCVIRAGSLGAGSVVWGLLWPHGGGQSPLTVTSANVGNALEECQPHFLVLPGKAARSLEGR